MDGATSTYLANAFKQLGHSFLHYPYRHFALLHGLERMNEDFVQAAQESDLTIVLKGEMLNPKVVGVLRQAGTRLAVWHLDPWNGRADWVLDIAREAPKFLTTAKGLLPDYKAQGADAHWVLEGCDPDVHKPPSRDLGPAGVNFPVSFVGTTAASEREEWLLGLRQRFRGDLHVFGSFPGSLAGSNHHGRAEEYCGLKGDAGLSWVVGHSTVNLGRDRSPKIERSYGARLFRTLAAGGYLVTNHTLGIKEDFPGCVAVYNDLDDCERLIRWGLERHNERRRMARRGQKKVLTEHTFKNRAAEILKVMGL